MWQQANCGYTAKMRMHEIVMKITIGVRFFFHLLTSIFADNNTVVVASFFFLFTAAEENNNFSSGINWVQKITANRNNGK